MRTLMSLTDEDAHKGAVEPEDPKQKSYTSMNGQLPHRGADPLIKGADSDFPEPGQNPEHTGEPEEKAMNSDEKDMKNRPKQERDNSEKVDQDPGERQKENQNEQKDDPLAA